MADADAPRLICAPCAVISDASASACGKCSAALTTPTVFDCARLGLLPELQQLVDEVRFSAVVHASLFCSQSLLCAVPIGPAL
jgi:hypothetical protein